jgi:hyperosmotically inducible periplasmic protein
MRTAWPFRAAATVVLLLTLVTGCRTATGRTTGQYIDDSKITASVKSKLVADKATNLTRVSVKTVNGTVYLDGVVDSADQKAHAADLAARADGVRTVVNNLQVNPQPAASPSTK